MLVADSEIWRRGVEGSGWDMGTVSAASAERMGMASLKSPTSLKMDATSAESRRGQNIAYNERFTTHQVEGSMNDLAISWRIFLLHA